ncbi:hypothetical protein [Actinoallomurus sp. CA-150999]|uniref:hypothetical protein n=1 Tax=Actinoallomurus sp. CA-150999 TaxID=3239887 RepID=UPI003D8D9641
MKKVSVIAAIAGSTVVLGAPAARASDWQPYRTQPFTTSGVCPFTVHGDIVQDEEEVRTDATFPDGTPRIQEFRGPLVIRFTNTANGKSAVRDVSGYGRLHKFADGGSAWFFDGGASVRVYIGNKAYPAGWYIVHGRFRLTIAPDNTRDFPHLHADIENLCKTLA